MIAANSSTNNRGFLFIVIIFICFLIGLINIKHYLDKPKVLGTTDKTEETDIEKEYWNTFLKDNPTYLDGWKELENIYKEEGNTLKQREVLEIIRKIDPNAQLLKDY